MIAAKSTASALAGELRDAIVNGVFAPGEALPQEKIAEQYGVSRIPLREALRQLEGEGWIEYRSNRGAFVARLTARDVRAFCEVRRILETGAIRLVVPKIDAQALAEAKALDSEFRRASEDRERTRLHRAFHQRLYSVSENPLLTHAIYQHHVRVQMLPESHDKIASIARFSRLDHSALLKACEQGDVRAAERATREHIDHIEAALLEGME